MHEPTWYWIVAGLTVVIFIAVPLALKWEERQERRDKEAWNQFMQRRAR